MSDCFSKHLRRRRNFTDENNEKIILYRIDSHDAASGRSGRACYYQGSDIEFVNADASYVYYNMSGFDVDSVGVYKIETGTLSKVSYPQGVCVLGGKNGKAYFSRYDTFSTYAYDSEKNEVTTVISNKYLSSMIQSKSGYYVFQSSMTQEEFEKTGYDVAMVRMKLDGTGYKILKKYFVP